MIPAWTYAAAAIGLGLLLLALVGKKLSEAMAERARRQEREMLRAREATKGTEEALGIARIFDPLGIFV